MESQTLKVGETIISILTISIYCRDCFLEKIPPSNFAKGLLAEMSSGSEKVFCDEYCNRECVYECLRKIP